MKAMHMPKDVTKDRYSIYMVWRYHPKAYMRSYIVSTACYEICKTAAIVMSLLMINEMLFTFHRDWHASAVIAAMFVLLLVTLACYRYRYRKYIANRLTQSGCALCAGCGYILYGNDNVVTCPECGIVNDLNIVRDMWRSLYSHWMGK